ncbi:MAG: transcriptional repressor NrdR [Xanthomonadales bacterium]|nr:transcriptional repressor NrdR [Xanthomonadales bacterium]MCE7932758.1 transcriptional repressor NrdR [Xanthomonadales bacterium PRO6]
MRCPFCSHEDTRVIDSRVTEDGLQIRRRRECPGCAARFSTYETAEIKLPQIVKRDGRREAFNEHKLRGGLARAFEKRAVSVEDIDRVIDVVMRKLRTSGEREIAAGRMGEWVMEELKRIDQVAYVRFASVYRRFEDVQAFREEVERLEKEMPSLSAQQLPLLEPVAAPAKKH